MPTVTRLLSTVGSAQAPPDRRENADVVVSSIRVEGSRLECDIDYGNAVREFFTDEPFYVEYDVDLSAVPRGVLAIPILSQICPAAWAAGADVWVPVVDRRFLESLRKVGNVLGEMYPTFIDGGRVVAGETTDSTAVGTDADPEADPDPEAGGESDAESNVGMLFTGGVDSLATYVRHRDENPTLINVRGWLIDSDDDRWRHAQDRIEAYGDRFHAETQFVRSNMLDVLDTTMLSAHFSDYHEGGWYSAVGAGLGMLGLCAPLATAREMETLYVAASHWEGFPVPDEYDHWEGRGMPWGSHPAIDGEVAWAGTDVVHDGFELTRQERVDVIADFVADGHEDLPLRACEAGPDASNCNHCEKCYRTALGLAFAGLDPNRHGFDLDPERFPEARERLGSGEWLPDKQEHVYWLEFQRYAREREELPIEDDAAFLEWLRATDFEAVAGKPLSSRAIRAVARHVPYRVYSNLYPVYSGLKE